MSFDKSNNEHLHIHKDWQYSVKPSILGKLIENSYFILPKNILQGNFEK